MAALEPVDRVGLRPALGQRDLLVVVGAPADGLTLPALAGWKDREAVIRKQARALERVDLDLARLRPEVSDTVRRQFEVMIRTVRTARGYRPWANDRQRLMAPEPLRGRSSMTPPEIEVPRTLRVRVPDGDIQWALHVALPGPRRR